MAYQAPPYDPGQARRTFLLIAAISFFFAGTWAYIFYTQKPRVADGVITAVTVVPLHTELRQGGSMSEGYGGGTQKSDELYVWVNFRMKNLTNVTPLYETQQRASLALADGTELSAFAADREEIAKVRLIPGLQKVTGDPVPRELTLRPGDSAEGLALFAFPVTREKWNFRRQFSMAVSFQWQRDLALKEPKPGS